MPPYKSVYNCILDRSFSTDIDSIKSRVHLKVKFHNLHGDAVTVSFDVAGVKLIYQVKLNDMKINVSSLNVEVSKNHKGLSQFGPVQKLILQHLKWNSQ